MSDHFWGMLWVGGSIPAYQAARASEHNIFNSLVCAVIWPADFGWSIVKEFYLNNES